MSQVTAAIYTLQCIYLIIVIIQSSGSSAVNGNFNSSFRSTVHVVTTKYITGSTVCVGRGFNLTTVNNNLNSSIDQSSVIGITQAAAIERAVNGTALEPYFSEFTNCIINITKAGTSINVTPDYGSGGTITYGYGYVITRSGR